MNTTQEIEMLGLEKAGEVAAINLFPLVILFDDWVNFCKRAQDGITPNLDFIPKLEPKFVKDFWADGFREIRRYKIGKLGLYDSGNASLCIADFCVEGLALTNEFGELFWSLHSFGDSFEMYASAYMRVLPVNGLAPQQIPAFEIITRPSERVSQ